MKKLIFGFLGLLFVLPGMAAELPELHLKGKIVQKVGDKEEPMVGMYVMWKDADGKQLGFNLDSNGEFDAKPKIAENTDLTLSFIGCEDEVVKANVLKAKDNGENKYVFVCKSEVLDEVVVTGVRIDGQPGCDNEDNEFIAPHLALCSVHAYNGGLTTNPTNETTRAYMRDVIALKTTFMTQQMNKQYEYLESMIRRFKTQLEKAILTTRLKAAGAGTDSSSSGGSSSSNTGDRNIYLSGVNNCNKELSPADVVSCLNTNLDTISNSTDYGNKPTTEAKKQFVNDIKLLDGTAGTDRCDLDGDNSKCTQQNMNAQTFRGCIEVMRTCLRNVSYDLSKDAKKSAGWAMVGQ